MNDEGDIVRAYKDGHRQWWRMVLRHVEDVVEVSPDGRDRTEHHVWRVTIAGPDDPGSVVWDDCITGQFEDPPDCVSVMRAFAGWAVGLAIESAESWAPAAPEREGQDEIEQAIALIRRLIADGQSTQEFSGMDWCAFCGRGPEGEAGHEPDCPRAEAVRLYGPAADSTPPAAPE